MTKRQRNTESQLPDRADSEPAALKYDKGDRRKKHVGSSAQPVIEVDPNEPRKLVGKCPRGLDKIAEQILAKSLPGLVGDRPGAYAKHRYAVHEGVIYEAATSDRGKTYHGYPYRGKLPKALIAELRKQAVADGAEREFDKWVKDQITVHGSWHSR